MSEQEVIVQETVDPEVKTIKEVADEYIASLSQSKTSTARVYARTIEIAISYFKPQRPINSITLPMVGRFFVSETVLKLPNGNPRANLTVAQIKRVFRQCMEFALAKGWIDEPLPIPRSELEHARQKQSAASQLSDASVSGCPVESTGKSETE